MTTWRTRSPGPRRRWVSGSSCGSGYLNPADLAAYSPQPATYGRAAHDRIASERATDPRLSHHGRSGALRWKAGRWGGWGSNPRPADYEKPGLTLRTRCLHG